MVLPVNEDWYVTQLENGRFKPQRYDFQESLIADDFQTLTEAVGFIEDFNI